MGKQFGYRVRSGCGALLGVMAIGMATTGGLAIAQETDRISKFLILKLSQEQSQVLCASAAFTSCMGFTQQVCTDLSEKALQQCIMPLPDTILLENLNSEVLEACPEEVYAEAGYSNDKASACLQEALKE